MTIDTLKTLVNGQYIEDVTALLTQQNFQSDEEKIAFLELVYTYNNLFIKNHEKQIRLAKEREIASKVAILTQNSSRRKDALLTTEEKESSIDPKVQEILSLLEICDLEEVTTLFPERNNPSFDRIINQVMVAYYREIVFLNNYLHTPQVQVPSKEKEEIQNSLIHRKQVFQILKQFRAPVSEESYDLTLSAPCLIHLETPKGESYLQKDIESLSPELYVHFLKIYEPLIKGEPVLSHYMNNNKYNKLVVVKNRIHQARIYTVHLTDNIQVILGALNKKQDWGKQETNYIDNRYSSFFAQKNKLLEKVQDETFLRQNQERTQKVLTLLKRGAR